MFKNIQYVSWQFFGNKIINKQDSDVCTELLLNYHILWFCYCFLNKLFCRNVKCFVIVCFCAFVFMLLYYVIIMCNQNLNLKVCELLKNHEFIINYFVHSITLNKSTEFLVFLNKSHFTWDENISTLIEAVVFYMKLKASQEDATSWDHTLNILITVDYIFSS